MREKVVGKMEAERSVDPLTCRELRAALDEEIGRLAEKYRTPVVLCYLEGRSYEQAARELGCSKTSLSRLLTKARELLRRQLERRGITLATGAMATALAETATAIPVPALLTIKTVKAATLLATGKAVAEGCVTAGALAMVEEAMMGIIWVKGKIVLLVMAFGLAVGGAGWAGYGVLAEKEKPVAAQANPAFQGQQLEKSKPIDAEEEKPRKDRLGDALPPGALARLRTMRLRHGHDVQKLKLSADGKTLLSADEDGFYIWETSTGRLLNQFSDHSGGRGLYSSAASADHRIVALSHTGAEVIDYIDLRDGTTGGFLRRIQVRQSGFYPSLVISADGKTLAVLVQTPQHYIDQGRKVEQTLRLFDTNTGLELHRLQVSQEKIHCVVYSSDGKTLVTANDDKTIRFWDMGTGKQVRQLDYSAPIGKIALAPDGKTLASVAMKKPVSETPKGIKSSDSNVANEIVLWDLATGKETHRLTGGLKYEEFTLVYSPDSKTLVSSDWSTTNWWDVATGKKLPNRLPHLTGVSHFDFTPDGSVLATANFETVRLWDVATGKEKLPFGEPPESVAVSPDSRVLVATGRDGIIRVYDSASGEETRQIVSDKLEAHSVAFSPDGKMLVSSGYDNTVRILDFATGKELRRFAASVFGFSSDEKSLVTASKDKFIRLWDISTGKALAKWPETEPGKYSIAESRFAGVALTPDGKTVISWSDARKIRLWDVQTGNELSRFDFHSITQCIVVSPDVKMIACGGMNERQIAFHDVATGKEVQLLKGMTTRPVNALAFSVDGRVLAAGDGMDGSINLWEMATGQKFQTFEGHKGAISNIAFSADGTLLLSCSRDTTALAWDVTGTRTRPKARPLTDKDLEIALSDLANADAAHGQKAVRTLLAVPAQAVALLVKELKPAQAPDPNRLTRLIADLNSEQFKTREEALRDLNKLGDVAEPEMRKALADNPSLELKRRLESLLKKFSSSQRLRTLRAVQVLEQLGTQPSRDLLARLAEGVPEALVTREARAAIKRLANLRAAIP